MCLRVDAEVMEDVPACGGKGEADILGSVMVMVLWRPRLVRRELDAEGGRSKAALYTFLRRPSRDWICVRVRGK